MSDYRRDAPAQQLLLISAALTEQPAIIDLNAAALQFRISLGTTRGGANVTRGVPAALMSGAGLEASASVMVLDRWAPCTRLIAGTT
jgi:hypothetical protein